jgi:dUTPase
MIHIRRLSSMGILPRFNGFSYDLYAANRDPMILQYNKVALVPLDIEITFPNGFYGRLVPVPEMRSCSLMDDIVRRDVWIKPDKLTTIIQPGERIAQFTIEKIITFRDTMRYIKKNDKSYILRTR